MASRASKLRDAARQRRRILILERAYIPKFQKEIIRAGNQAAKDFQNGGVTAIKVGIETDHTAALQGILSDLYEQAVNMSESYEREKFGKRFSGRMEKKDAMDQAVDLLKAYWTQESFVLATSLASTSLEEIRQVTAKAVAEALPETEVATLIQEHQKDISRWRARTIARTESHQAVMKSQNDIVESMDLPPYVKEWVSGSDGRVRKSHRKADGQRRAPGNTFNVGGDKLKYPGERGGKPENIINCRCTTVEIFDDLEERD